MKLNASYIEYDLPYNRSIRVYGGSYYDRPLHVFGIKMAQEIDAACDVDIPTRDFSIPDSEKYMKGLTRIIASMGNIDVMYAGCMGGIGRTGLIMAGIAKVLQDDDPIKYVRDRYCAHAVETAEQVAFIKQLEVQTVQRLLKII